MAGKLRARLDQVSCGFTCDGEGDVLKARAGQGVEQFSRATSVLACDEERAFAHALRGGRDVAQSTGAEENPGGGDELEANGQRAELPADLIRDEGLQNFVL